MKKALRMIFGLYILLLIYLLLFAEGWGRHSGSGIYQYNLVPFHEIRRYMEYRHQIGEMRAWMNLAGNVVGFIPFGICFPGVWEEGCGFWKTVLIGFELSLTIEVSQLILRVGSLDVDDIILNTLGICIGFCFYQMVTDMRRKWFEEKTV